MIYRVLVNDLEVEFPLYATSEEIYVEAHVANVVYDVIIEAGHGTEVSIQGHNAERISYEKGLYTVPDSETSSPSDSPYTSSIFNRVIISPNFLRVKTNGAGPAKIRFRGNFNG